MQQVEVWDRTGRPYFSERSVSVVLLNAIMWQKVAKLTRVRDVWGSNSGHPQQISGRTRGP